MLKKLRWRQKWYNVHCKCDGHDFGSDNDVWKLKNHAIRQSCAIFKIVCVKCGNYHWTYDTDISDKIHSVVNMYIYFTLHPKTVGISLAKDEATDPER